MTAAALDATAASGIILATGQGSQVEPATSIFREAEDRLILYETLILAFDSLRVRLDRRRFFQSIGALAANAAAIRMPSAWTTVEEPGSAVSGLGDAPRVDPYLVEDIAAIIGAHRRLYRQFSAERLLPATLEHLRMASHLAKSAPSELRDRLVSSIAEGSMLTGTLLFHDLGDSATASAYYVLTETAASGSTTGKCLPISWDA